MKEYILNASIHIRACVWAKSDESLYDIVKKMLDGEYEGIFEVRDINGTMKATGREEEEEKEEE